MQYRSCIEVDWTLSMPAEHPSLLHDIPTMTPPAVSSPPLFDQLSGRERDVLLLLAQGLPNKQIARSLDITTETVKWHLKNIYRKLQVSNRTQATRHVPRQEKL